jgi:tRNA modification GTPase
VIVNKTIFALSSGKPPAGIAVVRLSGPAADRAVGALIAPVALPPPRRAVLLPLTGSGGTLIDHGIVIRFPAPASFTGEDVVELHVTGGPAVVAALLAELGQMEGLRAAGPGEFARRAFDNGRMDLTEAEGLADLVDAETEAQRIQALRQASGGLRHKAEAWHEAHLSILAEIEAAIDFAEDEEDVSARMVADQLPAIVALKAEIEAHLSRAAFAERLRRGVTVVILGPPNAGKSTLINALAERDIAIVSEEAGTTRDLIEVHMDIGGIPVVMIDTAGIRETAGAIEAEGVRRARARAAEADLVLALVSPGEPAPRDALAVLAKADALPADASAPDALRVSAKTGEGMDALIARLAERVGALAGKGEEMLVTRERQRQALAACAEALGEAEREDDLVLRAEAMRRSIRALGELTGRISAERILDVVFSRFCIGK